MHASVLRHRLRIFYLFKGRRADARLTTGSWSSPEKTSTSADSLLSISYCLSRRSYDPWVFVHKSVCGDPLRSVMCVQSHSCLSIC
jgi:hypothetical protein